MLTKYKRVVTLPVYTQETLIYNAFISPSDLPPNEETTLNIQVSDFSIMVQDDVEDLKLVLLNNFSQLLIKKLTGLGRGCVKTESIL